MSDMFHYTSCGLQNIWLKNGFTIKETAYGKAVAIHDIEGLHKVIGLFLVGNKVELSGGEIRFLRKELDMSQVSLAKIIGVSENTIRGWENNRQKITKPADRILRILYREHVCGDGKLREIIERISELNRDVHRKRIEMEETKHGWKSAA